MKRGLENTRKGNIAHTHGSSSSSKKNKTQPQRNGIHYRNVAAEGGSKLLLYCFRVFVIYLVIIYLAQEYYNEQAKNDPLPLIPAI